MAVIVMVSQASRPAIAEQFGELHREEQPRSPQILIV